MVSMKKGFAVLAIATGFSSGIARADIYCSGPVSEYLVYSDGSFMVYGAWRNDWTYLCSTQGTWNGIPAETCFTWLGIVGSAKVHNKPVGIYYSGNLDCATLGTYNNAPKPAYVRMGQ